MAAESTSLEPSRETGSPSPRLWRSPLQSTYAPDLVCTASTWVANRCFTRPRHPRTKTSRVVTAVFRRVERKLADREISLGQRRLAEGAPLLIALAEATAKGWSGRARGA